MMKFFGSGKRNNMPPSIIKKTFLFSSLCKSNWAYASIYNRARQEGISFRKIYLQLDEGTLRFNAGQVISRKKPLFADSLISFRVYSILLKIDCWMIPVMK